MFSKEEVAILSHVSLLLASFILLYNWGRNSKYFKLLCDPETTERNQESHMSGLIGTYLLPYNVRPGGGVGQGGKGF